MPKRAKTPPPADDEPKFLTVVYPYPAYADMEKVAEQKALARWIACCIGQDDYLVSVYHKPASPTMLIIEVLRDFKDWSRLLGLHRWSEFLRDPTGEERTCETKIFYCTLSHGREVQKHGWRRVDVLGSWFNNWSPANDPKIKYPYPPTSYCSTPPESDKTNKPLCRPLPVADFPKPASTPLPPVGTPQSQAVRTANGNRKPTRGLGATRTNDPPYLSAPAPLVRSDTIPGTTPSGTGSAWSNGPPGLTPSPSLSAVPPLSTPSPSTGNGSNFPLTPPGIPSGPNGGWQTNTLGDNGTQPLHLQFAGLDVDDEDEEEDEWGVRVNQVWEIQQDRGVEEVPEEPDETNEWADYNEEPIPITPPDTLICPFHGPGRHCKKGICSEWKKLDAQRKRKEKLEKIQQEKEERKRQKEEDHGKDNRRDDGKIKFNYVRPNRAPPRDATRTLAKPAPPHLIPAITTSVSEGPATQAEKSEPSPNTMLPPTNRPARGRKMNTAKSVSPSTLFSPAINTAGTQVGGSTSGWDSKSSRGKPSSAKKVPPPPSSNGGWGSVKSDIWGKSSARGTRSDATSSNNGGWGNPSAYGDWNNPKKASKAPSVAGEEIGLGEDASTWANKQPDGKSWADQVDDELGSQLGDHKNTKSVAASSASGWGRPPSIW